MSVAPFIVPENIALELKGSDLDWAFLGFDALVALDNGLLVRARVQATVHDDDRGAWARVEYVSSLETVIQHGETVVARGQGLSFGRRALVEIEDGAQRALEGR